MEGEAGPVDSRRRGFTRRDFLKWTAAAGLAGGFVGAGGLSASGIIRSSREPPPAWEVAPGVVDYSRVPKALGGPTPKVLKVAQWYDYWPGYFLDAFERYIKQTHDLDVTVQWDVYTSNEELFEWITLGKRRYDVFFPSNYVVDLLNHGGLVYNLDMDWIPNFANMNPDFISVPHDNPFDQRGSNGPYVSVPYFWGTTGVGFRTDKIPKEEVEALGFDFLWMDSYQPRKSGYPRVELRKNMRMLDDERDVLGWGFKKAGWELQRSQGLTPTGRFPPDGPQWTTNETDPGRVKEAGKWLFACKPNLFDFNSTEDSSSLAGGSAWLNQAWSGDIMYAKRPDQNNSLPADYVIPHQGSTWWIDCAAIHSKSRNLWLAHEFINFIHDVKQNLVLTKWNLYSTPNQACYEALKPYNNGWDMRSEPVLYPNIYAREDFKLCDISGDVGLNALLNLYNPLWFDLTG